MAVESLKNEMVYLYMGKASKKKKNVGKVSESGRYKLEDERIGLASKATPLSVIITAGLVAIVTFMVYLPALHNEFTNWDDDEYIYENAFIRSIDANLFKSAFLGFNAANWHPLTWISHALDYAIWGLNPLGHHLTNIIFHALNAFMVVFLVIRLMGSFKKTVKDNRLSGSFLNNREMLITGALTGLLFGLHPLHVESVAWVAERKDLLCAFFFLLSIISYTHYAGEVNEGDPLNSASRFFNKKYLLAIGFFILALLSKPMAVSLPFVLLILDWYVFRRIQSLKSFLTALAEKLPFLALTLISSILTLLAQKAGGAMELMQSVPFSSRVLVGVKSLMTYLLEMILPLNLIPFYPYPENIYPLSTEYIVPIVLVIGITVTCLTVLGKHKLWLTVWSYYVLTLLPVLGIVQVGGQSMADRYTYLPSLAPFLIIGLIAARVYEKVTALNQRRAILRTGSLFIVLAMLILISYATIEQIGIWKDGTVFWNYVIEKGAERVPEPHNNLGRAYASKGQFDMAIAEYQTALRLNPNFLEAHNNLGTVYKSKGQLDVAIAEYQTALRLKPDFAEAHNNLGTVYKSKGQLDMAIAEYQTALRLKPDFAEAHNNLGNIYFSKGQFDMAVEQYQTALRLKPDFAEAHNNLGTVYKSKGQLDMAVEQYQTALRLKPDFAEAHNNLGTVYKSKGQLDMAIAEYQTAVRLKPDFAEAHNNLGTVYKSKGQLDMAIAEYQTALRLKPDFAEAHNNLGNIYFSKGQFDMAVEQYQTALRLKPDFLEGHKNLGIAYIRKGLKNEAIREFNAALEINPSLKDVRDALESLNK